MAFTQATAPIGLRDGEELSADNCIPERHIVIETLRNAAPRLGLSATVISTLDAMLSCLAPKRNHHTVFASNATLTFRRNGISERTIRRHAARLEEIGLLVRHDSPNRKRFTKHSKNEGKALRFGFDLTPLYARFRELAALAAEVQNEREQVRYLRAKIRSAANEILINNPDNTIAIDLFNTLRRKLTLQHCEQILSELPIDKIDAEAEADDDQTPGNTRIVSGSNGHFDRHHHNSNKEQLEKEDTRLTAAAPVPAESDPITLAELLSTCTEAAEFALKKVNTMHDVITHARTLAPMIGINSQTYEAAHERLGPVRTAITVWAIMQFHGRIKAVGAYFRSITTGSKSAQFSPEKLIRSLSRSQEMCH